MNVQLDPEERQMILLALAHCAVERPGWEHALEHIACKLDDKICGVPVLFHRFLYLRKERVRDSLPEEPTAESLNRALAKFDHEDVPVRDSGHQVPSG